MLSSSDSSRSTIVSLKPTLNACVPVTYDAENRTSIVAAVGVLVRLGRGRAADPAAVVLQAGGRAVDRGLFGDRDQPLRADRRRAMRVVLVVLAAEAGARLEQQPVGARRRPADRRHPLDRILDRDRRFRRGRRGHVGALAPALVVDEEAELVLRVRPARSAAG